MATQEAIDWIRDRWIPALRSGEHKQGQYRLRRPDDTYCCLGVACDLAVQEGRIPDWKYNGMDWFIPLPACGENSATSTLPDTLGAWLGIGNWGDVPVLAGHINFTLTSANDSGATFNDIADALEAWCVEQEAILQASIGA